MRTQLTRPTIFNHAFLSTSTQGFGLPSQHYFPLSTAAGYNSSSRFPIGTVKTTYQHLLETHQDHPIDCNFFIEAVAPWSVNRKQIAIRHLNEKDQLEQITYQQLVENTERFAACFSQRNLKKGNTIATVLGQHPFWWYTLLACIHQGIGIVPCSRLLKEEELAYRINHLGIDAVIAVPHLQQRINRIHDQCPSLRTLITTDNNLSNANWFNIADTLAADNKAVAINPAQTSSTDPFIYLYTSGTTGNPKPVLHNHSDAFSHLPTGQDWMQSGPDDLVYNASDTGWGFTAWTTLGTWATGARLLITPTEKRFNPGNMLRLLEEQSVTILCAAPTVLRLLVADPSFENFHPEKLKRIVTVGEALDETVIDAFSSRGVDIHVGFGQAETPLLMARWAGQQHVAGTMGTALHHKIELLDDDYQPVKSGEIGQIAIDTHANRFGLMQGYVNAPDATKKAYSPDGRFQLTGDYAKTVDGQYYYQGRKDDLIKAHGYRIGPDEIEKAGMSHPAVRKIAAIQVPIGNSKNNTIKSFILLRPGYTDSAELQKEIQQHIREQVTYKYPRQIEVLSEDEWNKYETISGKVRRVGLRELEAERREAKSHDSTPSPYNPLTKNK